MKSHLHSTLILGSWCLALAAAIVSLHGAATAIGPEKQPRKDRGQPPVDDVQDFVLLGDTRPVLIRLHVRIDGEPFRAVWDDFMRHLFKYLDVNGDGTLDKEELERVPSAELLLARGSRGFGLPSERLTPRAPLEKNKRDQVTVVELAAYYRKNGLAPLQVQVGPTPLTIPSVSALAMRRELRGEPQSGTAVAEATFALLDADKDGKLTREELAAAIALLRADSNDDEIVTAQELASYAALQQLGTDARRVVLVSPDEPADELVRRLLERYGRKTEKPEDNKLAQKDIGLDTKTFALLDINKDGKLDREELAGFARRPPDLELTVHLSTTSEEARIELNDKEGHSPLATNVKTRERAVLLDLGVVNMQLRPGTAVVRPPGLDRAIPGSILFDLADQDKKGYLEAAETRRIGILRGHFKLMDRDGDGKVTERELLTYIQQMSALQARVSASCVSLVFIDEGRGLFDLLDADRDGRLSVHELRQAPKLLARLDKGGKGYLTRNDVPHTYQLLVRRGAAGGVGFSNFGFPGAGADVEVEVVPAPVREPKDGPLWFRMMDHNADGYVSRREFLGSEELFNKIDTDGDGLISVEEAIRADALVREKK